MTDAEQIRERLDSLKVEHRTLDETIARLGAGPALNQLELQRLKKRKLALKDQIRKLEGMLWPDIIA